jgi:hypothetical protein
MDVLNPERPIALANIALARFTHGTGGGIGPERFVISTAIVVAGEAKASGCPED